MTPAAPYPSIAAVGAQIGALIAHHFDHAFREIMRDPAVHLESRFLRFVTGEPHPFGNFACMTDPTSAADTRTAIEPLIRNKAPAAALFTGPIGADVIETLQSAGFEQHEGMPTMAVEIDSLAKTTLPADYTLARVSSPAQRDAWADAFARGYGLPLRVGAAFASGAGRDLREDARIQYFWILRNGAPVCTSLVYLRDGVAGIYGVATLPEERAKGLGAFVTAEPLRIVSRLGYRVGILQASADGHPVYKRLGFRDFGELPFFVRVPA